jgi:hypothetical protein
MASKVLPKISTPGSGKFPQRGPHNPNVGTRGSGMAPKPKGGANMPGNDRPSMGSQGGLARVTGTGTGDAGARMPVQSPKANIAGQATPYGGQGTPPEPRGGPSGVRAGGKNQSWPNGPLYNDGQKIGGHGRGGELQKSKRKGIGAAFYGEYA